MAAPEIFDATIKDIKSGKFIHKSVRTSGVVVDAFRDEIDPEYVFVILSSGYDSVYACSLYADGDEQKISTMIDAQVSISGKCFSHFGASTRSKIGMEILMNSLDDIEVIRQPPSNRFDVPPLYGTIKDIDAFPLVGQTRRKVTGHVIAAWQGDEILVRTIDKKLSKVTLAGMTSPRVGSFIEAAGIPETDLFWLNLSRAVWRELPGPALTNPQPEKITAKSILTDAKGRRKIKPLYHGTSVRLEGTVRSLQSSGTDDGRILLECETYQVPIVYNFSASLIQDVKPGDRVEATGVCIFTTENWRPQAPFPHIEGFFLFLRTADDIRILAHPPWWTTGKLLGIIGALTVALFALGIWNLALKHLVDRRGRQLFKEQIDNVCSKLRTEERTRLAIELHDSISQNLSGISMQIDAANLQLEKHPDKTRRHLSVASLTLDSCREELRNCIWDLRNKALDEKNMDKVLQRTLQEHVENAKLQIRFNIPRARLSESTAHALVRIIRELVTNAIRHGNAKHIRIAGALETQCLRFSVFDDGCGFNPRSRPGVSEGHFGLQGVHERIRQLRGTITIDSAPGKGTKITAQIPTHIGENQNECD